MCQGAYADMLMLDAARTFILNLLIVTDLTFTQFFQATDSR